MRVARGMSQSLCIVLLLLTSGALSAENEEHRVRNIVLLHGTRADGSGWEGVDRRFHLPRPRAISCVLANDLSAEQAASMARSQVLNAADNFRAVISAAAWRSKPSWMLVAAKASTINPDLERWYAARADSHKVEVSGASHSVYVSRPKEVAALIEEAASHAR